MIKWTNEQRRLGDLIPWPSNPRHIDPQQAERLDDSMSTFGQVDTLAIGPDNEVYNGHQRRDRLMETHGPDHVVDVRVAERPLSEQERKKLTVYLHEGATGAFDLQLMPEVFTKEELKDWGASDFTIDSIAWNGDGGGETQDVPPEVDRASELQEEWKIKEGDLWGMKKFTKCPGCGKIHPLD